MLSILPVDHYGLVAGFCKEIDLANIIDQVLGTSEFRQVSFGNLFITMIINGLGFTGRTLHMYSEYFSDKPLDRMGKYDHLIISFGMSSFAGQKKRNQDNLIPFSL